MPLVRKTRNLGKSIIIIPSQLIEAFDITTGDTVQIIPLKNGEIRIRKIDEHLCPEKIALGNTKTE